MQIDITQQQTISVELSGQTGGVNSIEITPGGLVDGQGITVEVISPSVPSFSIDGLTTNIEISSDVVVGGSGNTPSPTTDNTVLVYENGQQVWKNKVDLVSEALTQISLFPTVTDDSSTTTEDVFISGNVLSNDTTLTGSLYVKNYTIYTMSAPSGVTYTAGASSTSNPYGTFIMRSNGTWELTPRLNQAGALPSITYTVSNGVADATGTLSIYLTPVNDAPIVGNDILTVLPDAATVVSVLGNDYDVEGNQFSITKINNTNISTGQTVSITNATVTLNSNQTLTVTPTQGFIGNVDFSYTVTDVSTDPKSATGNVTVTFELPPAGNGTSNYLVSTTTTLSFDWSANTISKMQSVVEPVTGATIRRLTDVTQDMIGQIALYNAYSRYPNENVTGEYVLAFASNSTSALVMDRLTGGIVCTLAYDNTGLNTHTIGAYHEVRWHYTMAHPYRVYYVKDQELWIINDVRDQANTRSLVKDFSTVIDWTGTPVGVPRKIYMDQEGNSSIDSDEWAWMAAYYDGATWIVRAYVYYQISTDTVHIMYPSTCGAFSNCPAGEASRSTFRYRPNMVEIAPDGSGVLIGSDRAYSGFNDEYMNSAFEAPYLWPKDFNPSTFTPFRMAAGTSHSGWSTVNGNWYYIHGDYRRDKWTAVPISGPNKGYGNEGQLDVNVALGAGVIDFYNDGGIYPGYHFGVCTGEADGWTFVSTYATQSISTNGMANALYMMEIKPAAESIKWFVAPACNLTPGSKADYNEAPASINLSGTRLITCGDWGGTAPIKTSGNYQGERFIDMYEVALPTNWKNRFTPAAPVNVTAPSISGTATQGQTLTRTIGTYTGYPSPTITGNWQRNGVDISGATGATYQLQAADVGTNIRYRENATNASGTINTYSNVTSTVQGLAVPVNTVLPSITGLAQQGSTLVGSDGSYTNSPTGFNRQWKRDGVAISGATSNNYTLVSADVGATITYCVTPYNALGSGSESTSTGIGPVTLSPGTISRVSAVKSVDPSGSAEASRVSPTFNAVSGNLIVASVVYSQTGGNSVSVSDSSGNIYTAGSITASAPGGGYAVITQIFWTVAQSNNSSLAVTVTQAGGTNGNSPTLDLVVAQYNTSSGTWVNSSNVSSGTDYVAAPFTTPSFNMPANSVAIGSFGNYYSNTLPVNSGGSTLVSVQDSQGWVLEKISGSALNSQTFTSYDGSSYSRMSMAVSVFTAA